MTARQPDRAELGARAVLILQGLIRQVESRSVVRIFVANHAQLSNVHLAAKRIAAAWHDLDVREGRVDPSADWAFCEDCGGSHDRRGHAGGVA